MDIAKKSQTVQRILFTKCLDSFLEKCGNDNISLADRQVALQILESRYNELESANNKCVELSLESEATESDIVAEIETHEVYKLKFLQAKTNLDSLICPFASSSKKPKRRRGRRGRRRRKLDSSSRNVLEAQGVSQNQKSFEIPMMDIPEFSGSVNKWLQFWSHFRKIHEDSAISNEDKFECLKAAMEVGSKAASIVCNYPKTAENYMKAFNSLKNRFGRDDLQVEFYTRKLLSLVLQNADNRGEYVELVGIYNKLLTYLHALETLGVTSIYAPMLYPLVEFSVPEDIVQKWRKTETSCEIEAEEDYMTDRLSRFINFLNNEVEYEKRAMVTHRLQMDAEFELEVWKEENRGNRNQCIFCDKIHENAACEKAMILSIPVIRSCISKHNCCIRCLKIGHTLRKCRAKLRCAKCGGNHSALVCWAYPRNTDVNS